MALRLVVAALAAFGAHAAQAQTWPSKPIRIIVAFAPGGSTNVSTRLIADKITPALGQLVMVENRAGANGNVGGEAVVRSPTDGYTFLASSDALASNPHLYKMTFDAAKDLVPVVQLTRQPVVLAAHPSVGVKTVKELIEVAKRFRHGNRELGRGLAAAHGRRIGSRNSPASSSPTCPTRAAARQFPI